MNLNRTNVTLAVGFLLLGLYLAISSTQLPAGVGRVPGAGFFPGVVGWATMLLAAALLIQTLRQGGKSVFVVENRAAIGGVIALTFIYLSLWGTGMFALRTAIFLVLFLRLLGERWRASLTVSAFLTAAVTLAFQVGLRVSLE